MLPADPSRYLFFTGKGGVGKTSLSAATAVALADRGRRVLLVSTDPASNLDTVLDVALGGEPRPIPGAPGLEAMNIDPEAAARAYRERAVGPYRGRLPEAALHAMEEQLSGACTVEVAAFDEFSGLLAGGGRAEGYDHVVFDTAPTGHTLRLLRLPAAWSGFLDASVRGVSCLGPTEALASSRERYAEAAAALADAGRSTVVLVSRPDPGALAEAARTSAELSDLGVSGQRLVLNGVFRAGPAADPVASAFEQRAREALSRIPAPLAALPRSEVALRGFDILGLPRLRQLLAPPGGPGDAQRARAPAPVEWPRLDELVDAIEADGHGLVMVMGKGGVGKTTLASALAAGLAARGCRVHLSTTDPAAHLSEALGSRFATLEVGRIDPVAAREAYVAQVMARAGRGLDQDGRALLAEELSSPCTEEIAVFHAFSRVIRQARKGFVVLDTAPTGHTLLLLDATGSYHRQVLRDMDRRSAGAVTTPLMRLRDPGYTKVLVATLPEITPVEEAARLQQDLRRAGIEPYAWIVNQALAATSTRDPVLARRAASERAHIDRVSGTLARRCHVVGWEAVEPSTAERLVGAGAAERRQAG